VSSNGTENWKKPIADRILCTERAYELPWPAEKPLILESLEDGLQDILRVRLFRVAFRPFVSRLAKQTGG